MKSWKTTLAGVGALLAALASVLQSLSSGDWSHVTEQIAAVVAGVGLILAKDHDVTGGSVKQ